MSAERIRRAYVVDDDEAFRHSLAQLLESAGWSVEAFAAPADFLAHAPGLEPGLLLLDLNLPGQSGLDLLERASAELDRFAVIMVTGAGAIQTAVRTIRAGAIDFIEKPFRAAELFERLDAIDERLGAKAETLAARSRIQSLSPRERDVLERLLGGASNKHIARDLDLSPRTVEMHRARMLQKLGVAATAEALELARRAGLEALRID
jgi:two-component system response regulator FixJ